MLPFYLWPEPAKTNLLMTTSPTNKPNATASGNHTAGVININLGSSPGITLATITFRAAYGANVHVLLTPRTDAAAGVGAYVTSTAGAFQIDARTPLSGASLSFDYLVAQ